LNIPYPIEIKSNQINFFDGLMFFIEFKRHEHRALLACYVKYKISKKNIEFFCYSTYSYSFHNKINYLALLKFPWLSSARFPKSRKNIIKA